MDMAAARRDRRTHSSRLRGIKSMRPTLEAGEGNAAGRRGSWDPGLRILAAVRLSGAMAVPLLDSPCEYRPTTGDPGGRGLRRNGDWAARGDAGCTVCTGCTGCERVKEANEGRARAARKAGLARGGDEEGGAPPDTGGACILTRNRQVRSWSCTKLLAQRGREMAQKGEAQTSA